MSETSKSIYRQDAIKARSRIDYNARDFETAADLFFEALQPKTSQILAFYWPKDHEFDVRPILERALSAGITCCLPVVQTGSRLLTFVSWDKGDPLKKGAYGILEPEKTDKAQTLVPDMLIVPLLAFDPQGYRLGYGGGYYDTTLQHLKKDKDTKAIGLAYAEQACLFELPREAHDQKLDYVITPQAVHHF